MTIIQSILTQNPCFTAGKKIEVKGLMLHSVGCNQPKASVFVNSWNKPSADSVCVHALIDANTGDVYQTLPWNHRGWHAGGYANNTHVGVEMCEPACIKYTGGSSFTCSDTVKAKEMVTRTYNTAVELFASLCKQYNLDPLKNGVIISHKEGHAMGWASNHGDPEHLWKGLGLTYTMDTFRQAVKSAMGNDSSKDEPAPNSSEKVFYRVVVSSFSEKSNAESCLAKAKTAGFKDAFITTTGGTSVSTTKKSVEDIAKEVIQGKWSNGEDRKKKLTEAGYDYSEVQKMVNKLLAK